VRDRLLRVAAAAGISNLDRAVLVESWSNDVWLIDSLVLRICWRGDRARLTREAVVATHLPAEVRYPELVAHGTVDDLTWTVTRKVDGVRLDTIWSTLDTVRRRQAMHELAVILTALHEWAPPAEVTEALADRSPAEDDVAWLIGTDLSPLPVSRLLLLAEHARRLPVAPDLIDRFVERIGGLAAVDPFTTGEPFVVVHGDAHLANLLWRDDRVVALLDLEWVRQGPRDLELEPLLRDVDWSSATARADVTRMLGWLREGYPGLFGHPDLVRRLWLYQLAAGLRDLFTVPQSYWDSGRVTDELARLTVSFGRLPVPLM
jgi:aminoglycoside phosphotransferase (APT) family kinase protein